MGCSAYWYVSFYNMARKPRVRGPLEEAQHQWLHATDKNEVSVDAAGDTTMSSPTSKRAREGTIEPGVGKIPKKEGMQDISGAVPASSGLNLQNAGGSTSGSNGTGETPVDVFNKPELGVFTETRTAILPLRFCCSFNYLQHWQSAPTNLLKIRMNAPYNVLGNTTFINQTEGAAVGIGISTQQAGAWTANNPAALSPFETTLLPATEPTATTAGAGVVADTSCRPAWRKWYETMYESYSTIACDYKITFLSPETVAGHRSSVYIDKDVYTTSSTGNIMPTDGNQYFFNSLWKGVDQVIIGERGIDGPDKWVKQISGTWRPGMWAKNTLNAEDIKAWYTTGAAPSPAWFEELVIVGRTDDFNVNLGATNLNILVELQYTVQFKDLKQSFRYPQPTGTAVTFTMPGAAADATAANQAIAAGVILQTPHTPYEWGDTT